MRSCDFRGKLWRKIFRQWLWFLQRCHIYIYYILHLYIYIYRDLALLLETENKCLTPSIDAKKEEAAKSICISLGFLGGYMKRKTCFFQEASKTVRTSFFFNQLFKPVESQRHLPSKLHLSTQRRLHWAQNFHSWGPAELRSKRIRYHLFWLFADGYFYYVYMCRN